MLDIRKIRFFIAVYQAGSITKAAEREHIAQPALTVHIQQLEDEFKTKLFERSAQGVSPTPAGETLYGSCLDLVERLDALAEQMSRFGNAVSGSISAGIMPSICHGPLAPMLTRYADSYPNVELRIVEGLSGTLAAWVLSEEVDFAICNRPTSTRGLDARLLLRDRLVLVSARSKGFVPFAPCTLGELPRLKLVLPSRNHTLRHTLDRHIHRGGLRLAKTLEIDGQTATLQFVAQSDWSTILPTIALINEFDSPRFSINPIREPDLITEIYALHAARRPLSVASERFIAMLEADLLAAPALPGTPEPLAD